MKIAVCTSDGIWVDMHFGQTESFYVYEYMENMLIRRGVRDVERYCSGYSSADHEFRASALSNIYKTICDCEILFTAKVGETPGNALLDRGINIVEGEIAVSRLPELIRNRTKSTTHIGGEK